MITNHAQFLAAIQEHKKVWLRFYSTADSGVLDRVCAPMDYGPGGEINDGQNRYWLWDYKSNTDSHTLGLVPRQIMDLQVLGEVFDAAQLDVGSPRWSIPRDWGSQSQPMDAPISAPVCEEVARAPAADRPLFTAMIGLVRPTRRAIRANLRGLPTDSR